MQGKNKYEYDSDEEVEGGTWEHKLREKVHTTYTTFICAHTILCIFLGNASH